MTSGLIIPRLAFYKLAWKNDGFYMKYVDNFDKWYPHGLARAVSLIPGEAKNDKNPAFRVLLGYYIARCIYDVSSFTDNKKTAHAV